jgi:hypothetical protein
VEIQSILPHQSDQHPDLGADTRQHIADGWIEIATEAMWFLSGRMMSDKAFQLAVLACEDITELEAVQAAFLKATIRDYAKDTREAAQIMQSLLMQRTATNRP